MKRTKTEEIDTIDDAADYDFRKMKKIGRGKYFQDLQQGYTITVHKTDGSTEVRQVPPPSNIVVLDSDVQAYFPDSEAVNRTLRGLIALIPGRHPATQRADR